ncbi:MAG: hypothetical protein Q4C12_00070 [Clostridia bacterium]|nr:hypothetical protein [Clostridia bacterium]
MSEFIIASISEQNRFIYYDKLGKMCVTNKQEKAAKYQDAAKAWRVLNTQMSKKKRDGWKVVAYEPKNQPQKAEPTPQRYRVDIDTSSIAEETFDWEKVRQNITESFSEIIAYKERLTLKLNQIEAELCDCEHACEFFKCDASHGYKLYAMIRERRIKRRFLKDELWKTNSVLNMSYSDIANGGIENAFKGIDEQAYEPRVLKELFSDALQPISTSTK